MFCSQGLADNTVIAKVNGELWDLDRPLEQDVTLQLLKFDDKDGKNILGFYLYNCSRFQSITIALDSKYFTYIHYQGTL